MRGAQQSDEAESGMYSEELTGVEEHAAVESPASEVPKWNALEKAICNESGSATESCSTSRGGSRFGLGSHKLLLGPASSTSSRNESQEDTWAKPMKDFQGARL